MDAMEVSEQETLEDKTNESVKRNHNVFLDEIVSVSDESLVQQCENITFNNIITESTKHAFIDCLKTCKEPVLVAQNKKDFAEQDNFLRGLHWSPCGGQLLSLSNDNTLRVHNFSQDDLKFSQVSNLESSCHCKEGDLVYDFAWYPGANASDPQTCCFVSSSKGSSIHLWDSISGHIRCSYRAYNQMDELTSPFSLAFDLYGERLFCGFEKMVRVFDVSRPGREFESRPTFVDKEGQTGLISCIAFNPACPSMYACGSYSRSIAVYYEPMGDINFILLGHRGGVTHLKFSQDGNYLFSGGRKDPEILCWDLRNPGKLLFVSKRRVETNQRIYFDLDPSERVLMSGSHDGSVLFWDVSNKGIFDKFQFEPVLPPLYNFSAHNETINSISCHPSLPLISTGSGQRHFHLPECFSDSDESDIEEKSFDNSIKLWWFGNSS